jgi:hypothetical protein
MATVDDDARVIVRPDTPQWGAWREDRLSRGDQEGVAFMDRCAAAGRSIWVKSEWPSEQARHTAEAAAGQTSARKATPLSEGARWLGLYGSVEEPLIDARGPLKKAGVRPSDRLEAVTTRDDQPLFRETRWRADDFLCSGPALRMGQHVRVEWSRDTETKIARAITYGVLLGRPDPLREEDCVPFLQAHSLTRKRLLRWWMDKHPEASTEIAEAALRSMNPRELQNATLLADNEDQRTGGNRHQVHYQPDAELWKIQ